MIDDRSSSPSQTSPASGSGKRSRRMLAVLELLSEQGAVSLQDLVTSLGVSAATARRDLADLEQQGLLTRTHGGARIAVPTAEIPVRLREGRSQAVKQRIGRAAAALLPDGPLAVAIGGGTTAATVARSLVFRNGLTIVTNSLTTAGEIGARPNLRVVMTGGTIRPHSFELVGVLAENAFGAMNVGAAFVGMDGVSAAGGATTHDEIEARTNAAMLRNAQRTIVVADSSKIGRTTLAPVVGMQAVHDLVTDDGADRAELGRIADLGVRVHVVASQTPEPR
ncbi:MULTISPECIES: DeoR/GlpR family DNA-binding transcription regulator [unclassified Curtobacterium]|uniref:DeoR/GlpR family DNA-binding transcription regulator n=1 Tax=unclassified Curtobacterium TaxID=257496 RepID=UPI0020C8F340|nr:MULTISPECIES: DeoR/GlpR family DNA-binding transcription regulator [unclassified Curtobacterium]